MLDILQTPSHVVAFRISRELSGLDYDRMIAELEARLGRHPRISVYSDLSELDRVRLDAMARDIRYGWSKRNELDRFARLAVVSDAAWLRAMSRIAAVAVPAITLRIFPIHERDAALRWASEPLSAPAAPGLQLLATTRADTFGLVWNGKVTRSDLERVVEKLKSELESRTSVRLLARIEHLGGVDLPALFQSQLVRLKLLGFRKIERYAVVGGPAWLPRSVRIAHALTDLDVRHFARDREPDAWAWLEAQPLPHAEFGAHAASDGGRAREAPSN